MLKGLIFDLDGVLTDSARYHLQAWRALAASLGIALPPAADDLLRGRSRMDSLAVILSYAPDPDAYSQAEKEQLAATKNAQYVKAIAAMTPADVLPGVLALLDDAAAAGLKLAIASASQNAPTILTQLNLADRFAAIVDPATLHRGKPDPEIYVAAQRLLGLAADEVVSFEDAPAGVAAIKAAHQFAVGIGDARTLAAADLVVPDTAGLNLAAITHAFDTAQ